MGIKVLTTLFNFTSMPVQHIQHPDRANIRMIKHILYIQAFLSSETHDLRNVRNPDVCKSVRLKYVYKTVKHFDNVMLVVMLQIVRAINCVKLIGAQTLQFACITDYVRMSGRVDIQ